MRLTPLTFEQAVDRLLSAKPVETPAPAKKAARKATKAKKPDKLGRRKK
jgi:hypothetical protein